MAFFKREIVPAFFPIFFIIGVTVLAYLIRSPIEWGFDRAAHAFQQAFDDLPR